MKVTLVSVAEDEKDILRNLLEKYAYEFSQYDKRDVNRFGLFGYSYLDHYWTEENRWAFLVMVDTHIAGFAMVNDYPEAEETDYTLAEFFILYKYRRRGVGQCAANHLFDRFPGRWQLKRHPKNIGAVRFWDRVLHDYTNGGYRLVKSYPGTEYGDGSLGDIYFFESRPR